MSAEYSRKQKKQINGLAKGQVSRDLKVLNRNVAGIDISPKFHAVAVPVGSSKDGQDTKCFQTTTDALFEMTDWLISCGVTSVAMESTGVYWIPPRNILEAHGLEVILVHAPNFRNVPGRKTDIQDAEWLQTLHSYGLLRGCFQPCPEGQVLRAYVRGRKRLTEDKSKQVLRMQKALDQMNVLVHRAVGDITGVTGMKIIQAIVDGERDPKILAQNRVYQCHKTEEQIASYLYGHYREHLIFELRQSLETYRHLLQQIREVDEAIEKWLTKIIPEETISLDDEICERLGKKKIKRKEPGFNAGLYAYKLLGVDLTEIKGVGPSTVMVFLAEAGWDMSRWPTVSHFTSWLCLCPGNHKSGGKSYSGKKRRTSNHLSQALRQSAEALAGSKSELGEIYRRHKRKGGAVQAIVNTAHKLARILYTMVKNKTPYDPGELEKADTKRRRRKTQDLKKEAKALGYELVPLEAAVA